LTLKKLFDSLFNVAVNPNQGGGWIMTRAELFHLRERMRVQDARQQFEDVEPEQTLQSEPAAESDSASASYEPFKPLTFRLKERFGKTIL